jgi:L-lactate dehydrogenase complex protein LldE
MRVSLFVTCLVDQLWPAVGAGAVEVLRRAGCEVVFDERQTCCGQPAFNTGYRNEARRLARRFIEVFEDGGADYVVSPSGSCTAMVHHWYTRLLDGEWRDRAARIVERTHELTSYLVDVCQRPDLGARVDETITVHDSCHGLRMLGLGDKPLRLLRHVGGIELVPLRGDAECCGFGGTFAVKNSEVSTAMLADKCAAILATGASYIAAADNSCLTHIGGGLSRIGGPAAIHYAEILAGGH